jgi:hypothetical protein
VQQVGHCNEYSYEVIPTITQQSLSPQTPGVTGACTNRAVALFQKIMLSASSKDFRSNRYTFPPSTPKKRYPLKEERQQLVMVFPLEGWEYQ